jgi:5-methylcytosine-specific restriction protein A
MLLKSCNRCGNLFPYNGGGYCTECLPIVEAEREARLQEAKRRNNRDYNKTRDPKYVQFYNSNEWRILSSKRLQDDGYRCVMCGGVGDEVDHIVEIKTPDGWERRLDYDNTRTLCHTCHNKRHNRFEKKRPTSRFKRS